MLGIYIHVPFCKSKCPYCDFYSLKNNETDMERYTNAVIADITKKAAEVEEKVDTVYFGGGTPSVIGAERLIRILSAVKESYTLVHPEITVECNPSTVDKTFFEALFKAGVNRISLGMQSAVDAERKALGRTADYKQVRQSIEYARQAGFENISVDLMLGIPHQTAESLLASIMFLEQQKVDHVSAYLLKIEEGTFFFEHPERLSLPDEDAVCDMYLFLAQYMDKLGYKQYEISNFAKPGKKSRHNLKYWHDEEYLGFGPAAHSFFKGKRYFYERDLEKYISAPEPVQDGDGGGKEEYVMLALRLTEGLNFAEYKEKFNAPVGKKFMKTAGDFEKYGFVKLTENSISITKEGFLISNTIIGELTNCLD